jgi:osmoprotectant transport system ATP-binding protein
LATEPIIRLTKVGKSFDGGVTRALREVSLSVAPGEFVALAGPSGSGKTTLLKAINRLAEVDGEVSVGGQSVGSAPPAILRRGVGYVFQGVGLFPHLSVAENIAVTPSLLGWSKAEIAARVEELLDLVGLPQAFADRRPDALSGGQRQRVGVARALAARPAIMLMDEPFGALDPVTRDALARAYRDLHDRLGLTTLMVTHDLQEALLVADRIVVLIDGSIAADDTPAGLLKGANDPRVAELIATPRRQAERIAALASGPGA